MKPADKPPRHPPTVIGICVSREEAAQIRQAAAKQALSLSAFLRKAAARAVTESEQ